MRQAYCERRCLRPVARYAVAMFAVLSFFIAARGFSETEADPGLGEDPAEYQQELITPKRLFKANHGSSIVELTDKTMLCAWYAGSRECAPDVKIYSSRFDPTQKTWSAPAVIAFGGERAAWRPLRTKSVGNVVLHVDDEGIVWAFYAAIPFGGWTTAHVDYRTSKDNGVTWSQPRTLIRMLSNLPRSRPVRVGPNRFAIPLYDNIGQKHGYTCTLTVKGGEIINRSYEAIPGEKHTQPAVVRHSDDELYAYLRDPTWKSLMFSRFDVKRGKWSTAERLDVVNPNAAVAAEQTPDGKTLLVFNDDAHYRVPLSLAYSTNGRDFTKVWDFETHRGGAYSYPALMRASDGSYHLTYSYNRRSTIKHIRFTEKWLNDKTAAAAAASGL